MTSFHVEQIVVCIDDKDIPVLGPECLADGFPKEGDVYTVRAVQPTAIGHGLLPHEMANPVCEWRGGDVGEFCFALRRFRPAKTTSGGGTAAHRLQPH